MKSLDKKTAIQSEQLRQMYSASIVPLVSSTILAAILAYMQRDVIGISVVVAWFSLIALVMFSRAILTFAYQRSSTDSKARTHIWLLRFRLGILMAGMAWGSAGLLLFPADYPQYQLFLLFMLAGLTAGAVTSYAADLVSALIFSILVLAPITIRLSLVGEGLYLAMSLATTLYLGFLVMSLRHINRNTYENIVLRLEAAEREATVKISEERYRLLLNHSPVGIFHYDTNLIITYSNNHFAEILHNSIERIIGLDMKRLKDQAIWPTLRQALQGEIGNYEGHYSATFSTADVWVSMTCAPFQDSNGAIVGGIGIVQDITERKLSEAGLRIAATVFEAQEGMIVTDENAIILRVNYAFTDITGYNAEDVVGKNPSLLDSGRQDARFYAELWEKLKTTGAWEGEVWSRRKNDQFYPVYLTVSAVKDKNSIVTHYVVTFSDITLRKTAEEEIKSLAFYDPLTKLPNRRLLHDRIHQALASSAHSGLVGALLLIDLDNFKALNDTLGHDIGDLLLQQVAQRILACVREGDTVARLGGDEFVVMLENLSLHALEATEQTEVVGEKILAILNQPYLLKGHEYYNTPSIGAALFNEQHEVMDDLFKQADIAMYQAKKAGRNTLRFFDQAMQDSINARAALEGELRKAIERRQFQLYYQIQVDDAGQLVGAETLIRWIHYERGIISPTEFIPLAEETGLILSIGQWALETACAQLKAWEKNTLTCGLALSVNVSAVQLHQADFVAQLKTTVQQYGINPARLKLELTESMLLEDIEGIIATMMALKDIGVQFSLDDFGTGYSSLQHLKRLPLYQLKIDQSFVRDIASDSGDQAIVRTIIAMATSLGLNVIAEGVETKEQRRLLFINGCKLYQGYLFGKPLPIEAFDDFLKQNGMPIHQAPLLSLLN